jgi:small-conductance mechanosensitive channel
VVFALALLANLGINITTFVASLGIGGIAIALAVQNVLGDLFASLAIAIDKPFEVGDFISTSDTSGTVEKVGLKTTRLRAASGEQIIVSNAELLKDTVSNFKRMVTRRIVYKLRAHPDTPAALAAKVPTAVAEFIGRHEKVRFDRAHLAGYTQDYIEWEIVYTILDADYDLFMNTQQAVILASMQMFVDLGISTAPRAQQLLLQEAAEAQAPAVPGAAPARHPAALRSLPKGA